MIKRMGQSIVLAIVIVLAFGAGIVFGQSEGIRTSIAQAATMFKVEQHVPYHTPIDQELLVMMALEGDVNEDVTGNGACPLWVYGQDPPAVGFYYHPENGRIGVLYMSVPEMRYFIKTFEGCDLIHNGYLE